MGPRDAGSRASSSWRMLVPDRAGPVMKIGAGTGVRASAGSRRWASARTTRAQQRRIGTWGVEEEERRAQVPEEIVAAHQPADDVQPRLGLEAVDEAAVGLVP